MIARAQPKKSNQRRVQQRERSRAIVVLVPIFIRNVYSLASIQLAPESARIIELASAVQCML